MKKKTSNKNTSEGFLTSAAQAIGTTLGQLAKKAGVTSASVSAKPPSKKAAAKKKAAPRKRAPVKKKASVKRAK
jgi:hypothetical protein